MRSLRTGPMNPEQAHMQAVKNIAELVARRSQVRWLRKMCKEMYQAMKYCGHQSLRYEEAIKKYEKEML